VLIEASGVDAEGVDNCIEQGMLMAVEAELGFRHELSRLTIAEQIPPIRRAAVNRAILRALEHRGGVDVARLARHAAAANLGDRASRYSLDAARCAAAVGSHGQAAFHYRTALRFASGWPTSERAELLDALAAECMVTDQMDEALAAAEEALRLWREVAAPLRIGAAHVALSYIAWYLGRGNMSHEQASQGFAVLDHTRPLSSWPAHLPVQAASRSRSATCSMAFGHFDAPSTWREWWVTRTPSRMHSTRSAGRLGTAATLTKGLPTSSEP
jgi:tetratricopeptide (TPR) repeat protein